MSKMEGIKIIIICLIAFDITLFVLTIICASIIRENKVKLEIDKMKIEHLEKKCDVNIESIDLLMKSLKDLNGIVKKIVKGENDNTDTKPDTSALIAGWKADEQEEQKLFSADEVRYRNIADACNSGMLLQSVLLAQGFAQTQQCIYPYSLQQSAIMPPIWNTSGNTCIKLGD